MFLAHVDKRSLDSLLNLITDLVADGKNRDMGCQDGTRSVRLRSAFCPAALASWVSSSLKPNK